MFNSPILPYVGMVLALLAIVATQIFPDYAGIIWTIAGFFGVGSLAALRTFIDSKGLKTYVLFGSVAICCVLSWLSVITVELALTIIGLILPVVGITMHQALAKSPTSTVPKIKAGS